MQFSYITFFKKSNGNSYATITFSIGVDYNSSQLTQASNLHKTAYLQPAEASNSQTAAVSHLASCAPLTPQLNFNISLKKGQIC